MGERVHPRYPDCGTRDNPVFEGGEFSVRFEDGVRIRECSPPAGESVHQAGIAEGEWVQTMDGDIQRVTRIYATQKNHDQAHIHVQVENGEVYYITQVEPSVAPLSVQASAWVAVGQDVADSIVDATAGTAVDALKRAVRWFG